MQQDLYFDESYTKAQLLEVLRTRTFEKEFVIEMIARNHHHTVLRLPPYYCIFNPIELMWTQLKKRIRRKNMKPKFDRAVIDLIKEEFAKISAEDWQKKI